MTYMNWRKSTYSLSNGDCVEVGNGHALVAVRDSKDPDGPVIDVSPRAWSEFAERIKSRYQGRAVSGFRDMRLTGAELVRRGAGAARS